MHDDRWRWHHSRNELALTAAGVLTLSGVFAPWMRSGSSLRSSFELFDLVERLGFAENGWFAWAVRLWPLVPLLLVGTVVAAWVRRDRLAAALGAAVSVYVGAVAIGATRAPNAGLIRTEWGVPLSICGAAALLVASVTLAAVSRSTRRARSSPA